MSRNNALAAPSALAPKLGIFWVLKQDCFRRTFSQYATSRFSWISWIHRWHIDSQQCSELRPQTASAKATGGRQDYNDFKSTIADCAATACITGVNWLCDKNSFVSILKIYIFWGLLQPVRCFVTPLYPPFSHVAVVAIPNIFGTFSLPYGDQSPISATIRCGFLFRITVRDRVKNA